MKPKDSFGNIKRRIARINKKKAQGIPKNRINIPASLFGLAESPIAHGILFQVIMLLATNKYPSVSHHLAVR